MKSIFCKPAAFATAILALPVSSGFAQAASIHYVGTQFSVEDLTDTPTTGWRNSTPAKPLDIDGDSILGTDGWRLRNTSKNPSYATATLVAPNNNNQAGKLVDNPTTPTGDDVVVGNIHDAAANTGTESAPLLQFVITNAVPAGETLRVGILFDVIGGTLGGNSANYTLKQTVGGSATATTPAHTWTGTSMDVAFFDLTGFAVGDTFVVTSKVIAAPEWPNGMEQVAGITFDTGNFFPSIPTPADGTVVPAGDVALGWTNPVARSGSDVWVDVWFGTNPGSLTQVLDGGLNATAFTVNAPSAATYYWRVDLDLDGNPDGPPLTGKTFTFVVNDSDFDGLPDWYELLYTDPPSTTAMLPGADDDDDNLTNLQEYLRGTLPNSPDTDDDTLRDGDEVAGAGARPPTDPTKADTDGDGIPDNVESNTGVWVNLITSLRSYYENRYPGKVVENAPFVLATLGQTPLDSTDPAEKPILDGQLAVDGDAGNYPQFVGNVKTVYSHPLSQGGASNGHYNQHAGTYMLVGDALGRAMVVLLSTTPPGGSFTQWIAGFNVDGQTGFGQDPDGDGIKNGVENYFGTHPGEFSQGLVSGISTCNTFTFTHPLNDSPASDLTAGYRWSKDLASFHADGGSHEGTTVSFSQGTPSGGMVTVTATITGTPIDRLFVDLEVIQD